jgi:SAM-dependent methyltransferase
MTIILANLFNKLFGKDKLKEVLSESESLLSPDAPLTIDNVLSEYNQKFNLLLQYIISMKLQSNQLSNTQVAFPFSNMTSEQWIKTTILWKEYGRSLLDDLPKRTCPACSCEDNFPVFNSIDGYPYVECKACAIWFVPLEVTNSLFDSFFDICPEAKEIAMDMIQKRANLQSDHERAQDLFRDIAPLSEALWSNPTYLDIGCGVGSFLEVANSRGYNSTGVDANPIMLKVSQQKKVVVRESLDELSGHQFSLITMLETIEHLVSPLSDLKKTADFLEPEGLLIITVPNLNSLMIRLMRSDCPHVFGGRTWPGHINLFNINGLSSLLSRAGLSVLDTDGVYGHNYPELASYLVGLSKGGKDIIAGEKNIRIDEWVSILLNNISPGLCILDRLCCTSPVLKVYACKKGHDEYFSKSIAQIKRHRFEEIKKQLNR